MTTETNDHPDNLDNALASANSALRCLAYAERRAIEVILALSRADRADLENAEARALNLTRAIHEALVSARADVSALALVRHQDRAAAARARAIHEPRAKVRAKARVSTH